MHFSALNRITKGRNWLKISGHFQQIWETWPVPLIVKINFIRFCLIRFLFQFCFEKHLLCEQAWTSSSPSLSALLTPTVIWPSGKGNERKLNKFCHEASLLQWVLGKRLAVKMFRNYKKNLPAGQPTRRSASGPAASTTTSTTSARMFTTTPSLRWRESL